MLLLRLPMRQVLVLAHHVKLVPLQVRDLAGGQVLLPQRQLATQKRQLPSQVSLRLVLWQRPPPAQLPLLALVHSAVQRPLPR